jgi:hypothetical protein
MNDENGITLEYSELGTNAVWQFQQVKPEDGQVLLKHIAQFNFHFDTILI